MIKAGKYRKLREACIRMGIDNADIANEIGRTTVYVSQRITGKRPWGQDEMFKIMDMIREPYENLYYIFPKGGMYVEAPSKEPSAAERIGAMMLDVMKEAAING